MSTAPGSAANSETTIAPCSDMTRSAGDDPAGSGTAFGTFLLLEYRRPWGREAARDAIRELLAPHAGAAVHAAGELRAFAIRPVMDRETTPTAPAWAGAVGHGARLTRLGGLPDETAVMSIAAGDPPGEPIPDVVIGVCTNGRRDRCCAVRGRPVATALHADFGRRITEISHLGGHRFAGTLLVLPTGYSYGFLDPPAARIVVGCAIDGLVHPDHLRGRADLSGAAQAADAYWRAGIGTAPLDDVRIEAVHTDGDEAVVQATVAQTTDRIRLRRVTGPVIAATICSGKPINTGHWVVQPG